MGYRKDSAKRTEVRILNASIRNYDEVQKNYTSEHLLDEITVSMEDPNPNIVLL